MPYNSPINDFDRNVRSQLDSASVGLPDAPGLSVFTAGQSASALMPEMMQLGTVMKMRAGLNQDARQIRILEAADLDKRDEQAEFDAFGSHLSSLQGKTPEQIAQANQDYLTANPSALRNKAVMESLKGVQDMNDSLTRTKQNALTNRMTDSAGKDLDFKDSQREYDEEAAANQTALKLEESRIALQAHKNLMNNAELEGGQKMGAALGQARQLPQDVAEGLIKLGETLGYGQENEPFVKAVADIVASHGAVANITESYAPQLQRDGRYIAIAQKAGVNLDAVDADPSLRDKTREAFAKAVHKDMLDHGVSKADADKRMESEMEAIDRAMDLNSSIGNSKREFTALEDQLRRLPDELGPLALKAKTDPAAAAELKGKLGVLLFRASKAKGNVVEGLKQKTEAIARQQEGIKLQKAFEDLASVKAARENQKERLDLAKSRQEWLQQGRKLKELVQLLGSAKNTAMMKKIKNSEDYINLINEVNAGTSDVRSSDNVFD